MDNMWAAPTRRPRQCYSVGKMLGSFVGRVSVQTFIAMVCPVTLESGRSYFWSPNVQSSAKCEESVKGSDKACTSCALTF